MTLLFDQLLNGLQFGAMLFLLAAGLTLIFGIMGVVNLTHGSFYMVGAYCAAYAIGTTGSFLAGVLAALLGVELLDVHAQRVDHFTVVGAGADQHADAGAVHQPP